MSMIENVLNVVGVVMLVLLDLMLLLGLTWLIPQAFESINDTIYQIKKDNQKRRKEAVDD